MKVLLLLFLLVSTAAHAYQSGDFVFDPHIGIGFNEAQGTYVIGGLDVGYARTDRLILGVGAYYAAGSHPNDDREIGGGPFAAYYQPLTSFLVAHIREDLDYIDQRTPIDLGDEHFTHATDRGLASITTFGLHVLFSSNFGISGGYRAVLPITNSDLGRNRSGAFLGFSIGF